MLAIEDNYGVSVSEAVRVTPRFPEMVTVRVELTRTVVTVKVAVVPPLGTVTFEGTLANEGLLLESATTLPEAGAGPFSVTVPVEELPPRTDVGFKETELRAAGVTVRFAVRVVDP